MFLYWNFFTFNQPLKTHLHVIFINKSRLNKHKKCIRKLYMPIINLWYYDQLPLIKINLEKKN